MDLVLPETNNADPCLLQKLFGLLVSAAIAAELGAPIGGVLAGDVSAFGAAMPETTVNENGDPVFVEVEVRLTIKRPLMQTPSTNPCTD